jgi:hypothetical protein
VSAWTDRYQFDPLWWATEKNGGNAMLPGRTNRLEDVAAALGWAPSTVGIDGGTVAALYTAHRNRVLAADDRDTDGGASAPDPERGAHADRPTAPPWDRLERYCEDDVRALATVYEHLRDAAKADTGSGSGSGSDSDSGSGTTTPTGENSAQGSLADFS